MIGISVVYALPNDSLWQNLAVDIGTTARQAIEKSGILERFPELILDDLTIGIFAMPAKLDAVLVEGDRVEIYRALLVDPKSVPRKAKSKPMPKTKKSA